IRSIVVSRKSTEVVGRHSSRAHRLALDPGAPASFLSCGEDGTVRHYDLRTPGACLGVLVKRAPRPRNLAQEACHRALYSIAVNPTNPHEFYVGGDTPAVRCLDARRVSVEAPLLCAAEVRGEEMHVTGVAVDWRGRELVATLNDGPVYRYDLQKDAYQPVAGGGGPGGDSGEAGGTCSGGSGGGGEAGGEGAAAIGGSCGGNDGGGGEGGEGYRTKYTGHLNEQTVKQVNFFGPRSEYVVSGSDCGHIFFWDKESGTLANLLHGDRAGAVNCLEAHPTEPILATSGLEHTAKLWRPTREVAVPADALTGEGGRSAVDII
ncbi:unnamed protein product, partial [Phaeothamnion confervicola]